MRLRGWGIPTRGKRWKNSFSNGGRTPSGIIARRPLWLTIRKGRQMHHSTVVKRSRSTMQSKNREIDIFLCDDEPELVEDIAEFLRMEGYSCRSTSSPHEARNFIRSAQRPFVLLSDMRMPGITGLDLARTAAEGQGPARNFEVILFSAFSDMERAIEALKIGVLDFLMKPFDLDQLRLALQRALEQIEDRRRQSELGNGFSHQLSNALSKIREVASALEAAQVNTQAPLLQTQAYRSPVALARERDDWIIRGIKLHQSTRRLRDKTFPM